MIEHDVIGMEKYMAIVKIEDANLVARIIAEDGEHFIVTMDYNPSRLNLEIVDGKVIEATRG